MRKQVSALTIAFLLALSMLSVLTLWQIKLAQATSLFSNGLEEAQFNPSPGVWTSNATSGTAILNVTNNLANEGSYSCYHYCASESDTGTLEKDYTGTATNYNRVYLYLSNYSFSAGNYIYPFTLHGAGGWSPIYFLGFQDATAKLRLYYNNNSNIKTTIVSATTVSKNTWHCLEVMFNRSDTGTTYNVWLDGSNVTDLAVTTPTASMGAPDYWQVNTNLARSYSGNFSMYLDSVIADSVYIGPIASPDVTVTIASPIREYYVTSTVSASFTASGGTIDKYWYNLKNDTSWVYVANQTYTVPVDMTGLTNGILYTFYAFANNTGGKEGVATVRFNIDLAGYKAASGSLDHIQAKVDLANAAGGGNVYVPAGNFTFTMNTSRVDPTYGNPMGIQGYGGVNITGGIGEFPTNTILFSMGGAQPPTNSFMIYVSGTNGKFFRICGLYFQGWLNANADDLNTVAIFILDSYYRIDHCNFTDFSSASIQQRQYTVATEGLIDHVNIDNQYRTLNASVLWAYGIIATCYSGNMPWSNNTADLRGNFYNGTIFIEDSWFNCCRYAMSSNDGAYFVFRHNTVYIIPRPTYAAGIDIHQGDASNDGGRGAEVYNNTFTALGAGFIGESSGFKLRGGMSLIYNNTVTGALYSSIALIQYVWSPQLEPWKNQPRDTWEWNNVYSGQTYRYYQTPSNWADPISDNVWTDTIIMHNNTNYALLNNYTAYPYPHPWALDASIPLSWDRISQNATSVTTGGTVSVASYWKYDDTTRSFYYVESNRTGSWTNGTVTAFSGGTWANGTLLCSVEGTVGWRVHANDSANVWMTFDIQFVTVTAAGTGWSGNFMGVLNIQISTIAGVPKSIINKVGGVP